MVFTRFVLHELSPHDRLRVLRETDLERRWYSVDDKRICLVCERVIDGRDIRISGGPDKYHLGCPTQDCPGNFSHWLLYQSNAAQVNGRRVEEAVEAGSVGEIDFMSDFGDAAAPAPSF
jgi:hypothetical protein